MPESSTKAILDFLDSFDSAKGHFKNSQRELLLALRDVFHVFAELAEQTESEALGLPVHVLRGLVGLMDYLAAQIPETGDPEDVAAAKKDALKQLIQALESEVVRTGKGAKTQVDLSKVEALQALIKYLQAELETLCDDSAAAKQRRQRITKIDID